MAVTSGVRVQDGGVAGAVGSAGRAQATGGAKMSNGVETISRAEARRRLGLEPGEFRSALELGEIAVTGMGARRRIPVPEVHRLLAEPRFPDGLRERIADVGAGEAAGMLGVTAYRFRRLALSGKLRPVRWYVNRYRVVVWRYLVSELESFAAVAAVAVDVADVGMTALDLADITAVGADAADAVMATTGADVEMASGGPAAHVVAASGGVLRHPPGADGARGRPDKEFPVRGCPGGGTGTGTRSDTDPGADRRARGWRARRVEQLLRDAGDPWEKAAVWAALAGGRGEGTAGAHETAYLRRLLPSLHGGGAGWRADPHVVERLCTAEDGQEAESARRRLAVSLARARAIGPAPALVPARTAADVLGCRASALPRAYADASVPRDLLGRWRLAPPPWLRSARGRTKTSAASTGVAEALG